MPKRVQSNYLIKIIDPDNGQTIALVDQFKFLQISKTVNKPGYYQLVFDSDQNSDLVDLAELDARVEFYRMGGLLGDEPLLEFVALNRTYVRAEFRSGIVQHSLFGRGLEDFLHRRVIASYADVNAVVGEDEIVSMCGGVYNAPVEVVMQSMVKLHAGDLALAANGRLADGVTYSMLTDVDPTSGGATWTGDVAYQNLLEVLQDLSEWSWQQGTPYDFSVQSTGGIGCEFLVHQGGRGVDRSLSTGTNPVVFSSKHGNLLDIWVSRARSEEINRFYVLGDGDAGARDVEVVQDVDTTPVSLGGNGSDSSLYNLIEAVRSAPSNSAAAQLQDVGEIELAKNAANISAVFVPRNQPNSVYGIHYGLGDIVTVIHEGIEADIRIVGVEILVTADGRENIQLTTGTKVNNLNVSYFSIDPEGKDEAERITAFKSETEVNRTDIDILIGRAHAELTR